MHLSAPLRTALLALILSALALGTGCTRKVVEAVGEFQGDHLMKGPVGIGPHQDQLKESPCACVEIPLEGSAPWAS